MATSTITVHRANARNLDFTLTYKSTGSAYNLTGKTVIFSVKFVDDKNRNNHNTLIQKTITVFTAPTLGQFQIALTPTDTNFDEAKYKWDILVKTDDTDIQNSSTGDFIVTSKVTENE